MTTATVTSEAADDDPFHLTDEQVLALTDEEFDLYVRILEAERLGRSTEDAEAAAAAEAEGRSRYQDDPVGWIQDVLGEYLWSKQQEIVRAVVKHRRVAVKSCHGVGKTFLVARLACWWIENHKDLDAGVISTAPSNDQVVGLLWKEINIAHEKGGLKGRVNQTNWWLGNVRVAFGRKPSDTQPGAMVGAHSLYNLVILDEADGVADSLWTAAGALATNDESRIIAIGNPDTAGSRFEKACKPGSGWHVITIDAHESPNWTGEYVPERLKALLVSKAYEQEVIDDHGIDSPVYLSKIRGQFPKQNANAIVRDADLQKARAARPMRDTDLFPVELGVDVAAGGDRSVIRLRRGVRFGSEEGVWVWRSQHDDSERLVREILDAQQKTGATSIKIDANGVGWAVVGAVRKALRKQTLRGGRVCHVHGVMVGQRATNPKRFKNLRAELWWLARELCEAQVWDLSLIEEDDPLLEELKAPNWSTDAGKRIVVEQKDEVRKRLGRSPDDADAALLAYYTPPSESEQLVQQGRWAATPRRR